MKNTLLSVLALAISLSSAAQVKYDREKDWVGFDSYAEANAEVKESPKVIFIGDSITEFWGVHSPSFFTDNSFLDRGISSQCTANILCRFHRDVVDLHPQAVVIMAGTNDIAGNPGAAAPENVVSQIAAMCDIARHNGIIPVIESITPCNRFFWNPTARPGQDIIALNKLIKAYADAEGITYVDYHSAMTQADGSLPEKYSKDGCHPVLEGYKVMESIVLPVLKSIVK